MSERLHSVTAQFDHLRSIRFQDAINRAMPRKKIQKRPEIKPAEPSKSNLVLKSDVSKVVDHEVSTTPMRVQEQLLDDETKALQVVCGCYMNYSLVKNLAILLNYHASCVSWNSSQVELTSLLDAVQETETKMIEMSALNHLMSTHVLQQAQQIQYLYDQV